MCEKDVVPWLRGIRRDDEDEWKSYSSFESEIFYACYVVSMNPRSASLIEAVFAS